MLSVLGEGVRRPEFVGDWRREQKGNGDRALRTMAPGSIPCAWRRRRLTSWTPRLDTGGTLAASFTRRWPWRFWSGETERERAVEGGNGEGSPGGAGGAVLSSQRPHCRAWRGGGNWQRRRVASAPRRHGEGVGGELTGAGGEEGGRGGLGRPGVALSET